MTQIDKAQTLLKECGFDGWLLYDFHGSNPLARQFLGMHPDKKTTRRFFYWVPAQGSPIKLVHAIEAHTLDALPGEKRMYASWSSLGVELQAILKGAKKVAMEYSPNNAIPYVSCVDGGTVDFIRSLGHQVVSSADFLPHFTAVLTEDQIQSQLRAAAALNHIVTHMWKWIREHLGKITELDAQHRIVEEFHRLQFVFDHPPIVAVNAHSALPHYEPGASLIQQGDWILIDLWAKEKGGIYGDIAKVAVAGRAPSSKQAHIFQIVRTAQRAAVSLVKERLAAKKRLEGWEVDDAARSVIRNAGYGEFFTHRTGHSIEENLHGSGAHMDNLEMHDVRPLLPGTCFSIEPGIYLPGEFGVRLELDLLIHRDGRVEISGGEQDQVVCLLL
ncbi:MAG: M24 family metallopeptidase [Verrucomicrobia bacterium]|nr:M24 family metallopeptidase [Verrucomicrobiota bacterium]MBU6446980.1 M24 family metallopeptidase [Verrucomicrobiota bacterium]MDE3047118.1 M24 family metallopeptidase [Verrucomicrobiota bacterium]